MLLNYFFLYLNRHQASEAQRRIRVRKQRENDEALLLALLL